MVDFRALARQQAALYESWLARAMALQAPGEPLYFRAFGSLSQELTARRALEGLAAMGRKVKEGVSSYGAGRLLAETAAVILLDAVLLSDDPGSSFADAIWRDDPAAGFPPPSLHGAMIGLTSNHLLLVGIGRSLHPHTYDTREAPLWVASYTPQQLDTARVQMTPARFLPELVTLAVGVDEAQMRFAITTTHLFDDNVAQGRAMMARLASAGP
jgi:hypothetical protein